MKRELPLLADSVRLEGDEIAVLDETLLPDEVRFHRAPDCEGVVEAIRGMKTRAFGQLLAVLYALQLTARRNRERAAQEIVAALRTAADRLSQARPTFPLGQFADGVVRAAEEAQARGDDVASAVEEHVRSFVESSRELRHRRASFAATLLHDGDAVLTHCNVSGELVMVARTCREQGKSIRFYATETRPYLQGARLTAWELPADGHHVTLLPDGAAAGLMSRGMVSAVLTGADRCAANGDVANKVGTLQLALLAKRFGVPFYVMALPSREIASGAQIPIEERAPDEVLRFRGRPLAPEGSRAYYPSFDVTPACCIDRIITFEGVFPPSALPS